MQEEEAKQSKRVKKGREKKRKGIAGTTENKECMYFFVCDTRNIQNRALDYWRK